MPARRPPAATRDSPRSRPHQHTAPNAPALRPQPQPDRQRHPPADGPAPAPFSWSSSLLTSLTLLACIAFLGTHAATLSTRFALHAALPLYTFYPPLLAAMLVGAVCAFVCYAPTMLAVLAFYAVLGADVRRSRVAPPAVGRAGARDREAGAGAGAGAMSMVLSVMRDGAGTVKLALLVVPVYVMAVGRGGWGWGERDGQRAMERSALEAAAGGQLAAALMTLRILGAGVREMWDLVPLVVFRWDRERRPEG
ncbi:hypothetical protein C8Q80DRAFT_1101176 [Daedaleopsis nitida]|nr:hypothetical protein C8Q80DRAFT_1101176 [Daedaleopsis nitida]